MGNVYIITKEQVLLGLISNMRYIQGKFFYAFILITFLIAIISNYFLIFIRNPLLFVITTLVIIVTLAIIIFFRKNISYFLENFVYSKSKVLFYGILVIFTLITLMIIFVFPSTPISDFNTYNNLAQSFSEKLSYVDSEGNPTAYRPMGYPVFLGIFYYIFGYSLIIPKILNILLSVLSIYLVFLISRAIFNDKVALLASLFYSFIPSTLFYINQTNSEILYTALLLLTLYFYVRTPNSLSNNLLVGLFLGLALVARPSALIIIFFIFIDVVFRSFQKNKRRFRFILKSFVPIFVVFLFILTILLIRNNAAVGAYTLPTYGGEVLFNSLYKNNVGSYDQGLGYKYIRAIESNEVERNRLGYKLSKDLILQDPIHFLKLGVRKQYSLYTSNDAFIKHGLTRDKGGHIYSIYNPLLYIDHVIYALIFIFGLLGFIFYRKGLLNKNYTILFLFIWSTMVLHFITESQARYHFPLIPIYIIFTGYFIYSYFR